MTRSEAVSILKNNHGVRITHRLFEKDEYIYSKENGMVYDELGFLFESWNPEDILHNGIRMRNTEDWQNEWSIHPTSR